MTCDRFRVFVRRQAFFASAASLLLGSDHDRAAQSADEANAAAGGLLRVASATAEMQADDAMVIGGGIGPGRVQGQEGRLQATAVVIQGDTRLCIIAVDVLMMTRDDLDQAAHRIEQECGIPFDNIMINASHTHHAPTTVTVHGYERDETFCRRTVDAIVTAAGSAAQAANQAEPSRAVFWLGQEATVGQNSRQLLKDGQIYWIGSRDAIVRPTGPFDVDLPVIAFQQADGRLAGMLFNHSTHCIGSRTGRRSPGFYGLAAQELSAELAVPVAFLSGAAGSTHNLGLDCDEMVTRIKSAVRDALNRAQPMASATLASIKRELPYQIRTFDDAAQEAAVTRYCRTYAPDHADAIISVFRDSRANSSRSRASGAKCGCRPCGSATCISSACRPSSLPCWDSRSNAVRPIVRRSCADCRTTMSAICPIVRRLSWVATRPGWGCIALPRSAREKPSSRNVSACCGSWANAEAEGPGTRRHTRVRAARKKGGDESPHSKGLAPNSSP